MGGLSYLGEKTGVYYNFLGNILRLQGKFGHSTCVFCFDHGTSLRQKLNNTYKENRRKDTSNEHQQLLIEVHQQIQRLRDYYLPKLGFRNIFHHKGYEADDLIAAICHSLKPLQKAIIVSTDSDLFQLISKQVKVYNIRHDFLWNISRFRKHYGIHPRKWAMVKAMAGCPADGISGISGVGESTAIKYLNGELPSKYKKYKTLSSPSTQQQIKENLKLTKLPLPGTPVCRVQRDRRIEWTEVLQELRIRSLQPELVYREKKENLQ